MPVNITLPLPPTVNHMYHPLPGGGRTKTRKYRAWEEEAGFLILEHKKHFLIYENHPPYEYDVWFYFPDRRVRDADNLLKPLQDLLARILEFNDRDIEDATFHKRIDRAHPRCDVSLWGNGER